MTYWILIALLWGISLYMFVQYALPDLRESHRFYQASRLKWDGFKPPFLMCWTYWIGVEKLFFRSKIHDEERMAAYLRYEFD